MVGFKFNNPGKRPLDTYYAPIDHGNDAAHDDGGPRREYGSVIKYII